MFPPTVSGCTHWMREPGTDNSINVVTKIGLTGSHYEVLRWRPEHSYQEPETVATFTPKKSGYFHSFSITENYVVLLIYPVTFDGSKAWSVNFHIFETMTHNPEGETDIYLINLKTGHVTRRTTGFVYSNHHGNAYETKDEIFVDISSAKWASLRDYLKLKDMLNPPTVRNLTQPTGVDLLRLRIGLHADYVQVLLLSVTSSLYHYQETFMKPYCKHPLILSNPRKSSMKS